MDNHSKDKRTGAGIYIRPLREEDALVSYRWRNDPLVWEYTGSRPTKEITREIETEWIRAVLSRDSEKRFAICITETDEYIGNVQLTHINRYEAEFHIFIGERSHWGKGYGAEATRLVIDYGFEQEKLQSIYLYVNANHTAAIKAYEKSGFKIISGDEEPGKLRMAVYSMDQRPKLLSVFVMAYNHSKFIEQTLQGFLDQKTTFDIEVIIGEDKSTDNTRDILIDYASRYPGMFKLILYQKNIGASLNQINILKACNGKYIALCEGDDYWTDPLKLQKQVDFLENNPDYNICFHRARIIYEPQVTRREYPDVNRNTPDTTTIDNLSNGNYIHTASVVFRNIIGGDLPEWFDKAYPADWALHLLNAGNGKIKFMNEEMCVYRVHNDGVHSTKKYSMAKSIHMLSGVAAYFKGSNSDVHRKFNNYFHNVRAYCYGIANENNQGRWQRSLHLLKAGLFSKNRRFLAVWFLPLLFGNKTLTVWNKIKKLSGSTPDVP